MKIRCPECDAVMVREGPRYSCPKCPTRLNIEESSFKELRKRLSELKLKLGEFSLRDLKTFVQDRQHPVTDMLIRFSGWGLRSFARWPIFMAVVVGLSWLLGPWGLMMMILLPIVYRLHRDAIEKEAKSQTRKEP